MQVPAERLLERLGKGTLEANYFFYGEEPLQLSECSDALRRRALDDGILERLVFDIDGTSDWGAILAESSAMSLFAERRLIEIRLGSRKADKTASAALEQLATRPPDDDIVLASAMRHVASSSSHAVRPSYNRSRAIMSVGRTTDATIGSVTTSPTTAIRSSPSAATSGSMAPASPEADEIVPASVSVPDEDGPGGAVSGSTRMGPDAEQPDTSRAHAIAYEIQRDIDAHRHRPHTIEVREGGATRRGAATAPVSRTRTPAPKGW